MKKLTIIGLLLLLASSTPNALTCAERYAALQLRVSKLNTRSTKATIDAVKADVAAFNAAQCVATDPTPTPPSAVITDRLVRQPGPTPQLGPAGSTFTDAAFGSRMARVTDATFAEDVGLAGRIFATPSSSYQQAWSADNRKFYVVAGSGTHLAMTFDPVTMKAARYGSKPLPFSREAATWDSTNPNILYGIGYAVNHHTIVKVDTSTPDFVTTTLLDLDTVSPNLGDTYIGAFTQGNGVLSAIYGGETSDRAYLVVAYPMANPSAKKVLNTLTREGMDDQNRKFYLHSAQIDKSGRYIDMVPTGATINGLAPTPIRNYIWDIVTDTVTPILSNSGGHESLGFGKRINADAITTWDAAQWILSSLADPNGTKTELIAPVLLPREVYGAEHSSWNNATATSMLPMYSGFFRTHDTPTSVPHNDAPWRAWDQEVISIATDGSGVVKRFAHHRSLYDRTTETGGDIFWYTPRVNVSNDGKYVLFTSNWDKSLGLSTADGGMFRTDVFIVEAVRP